MKKSRKLNIIDITVLVVVILAVGFLVYNAVSNMETSGSRSEIRYVIEVAKIHTEMTDKIEEGQIVYDESGNNVGTVQSVAVSPAYYEGSDENGEVVYSRIDGYSVMYVTVSTQAKQSRGGYKIEDTLYAVGNEYSLRTPALYFEGALINIQETEN